MASVVEPLTGDIQISDRYYNDPPKASISEGYREFFKALPRLTTRTSDSAMTQRGFVPPQCLYVRRLSDCS